MLFLLLLTSPHTFVYEDWGIQQKTVYTICMTTPRSAGFSHEFRVARVHHHRPCVCRPLLQLPLETRVNASGTLMLFCAVSSLH